MPPIWPVISTKGVHEALETGGGPPQTDRPTPDNLPGRHALSAFKQGTAGNYGSSDSAPIRSLGLDGEQNKIPVITNPVLRVSGVHNQLPDSKPHVTFGKEQEDTTGSSQASPAPRTISTGTGHIHWEGYSNLQSGVASPIALQGSTKEAQLSNNWKQPHGFRQVLNPSPDRRRNEEGSSVVDDTGPTHCGNTHMFPQPPSTGAGIRCVPERMGSTLYGNQHGRMLVIHGSAVPHQLPRTIGCLPSPQDLCELSEGPNSAEDGQCISSDIHQSKRGHTLNTTVQSIPSDLGVVHPEGNYVKSGTSAGQSQHSCRHGIPDGQGQMRLDDQSKSVPTNTTVTGTTGDRSRLTKQLPRYYGWRPDPKAEATDAFLQNWAQAKGFANPHGA